MDVELLSGDPTDGEYTRRLEQDLATAELVRFVMAYVSDVGLAALGRDRLRDVLLDPRSFGVASMSCACHFSALCDLQDEVEAKLGRPEVRLKYFMDLSLPGSAGAPRLTLVHSKLIYLVRADGQAVVYCGSHNWTGRALGALGARPTNAEATLRLQFDFEPDQLEGKGSSLGAEVNDHLRQCFGLALCRPATRANRTSFQQWRDGTCGGSDAESLDEYAVVAAVATAGTPGARSASFWSSALRAKQGIYLQCLEEGEGRLVREHLDRVLVLVWVDEAALKSGLAPVLLFCKVTTTRAGPDSWYVGQEVSPLAGFDFAISDRGQAGRVRSGKPLGDRTTTRLWSGVELEHFDFEVPVAKDTVAFDGKVISTGKDLQPKYQHYLQVYEVAAPAWLSADEGDEPAEGDEPTEGDHSQVPRWHPGQLALVARAERREGPAAARHYAVDSETRARIEYELREVFHLDDADLSRAKMLPTDREPDLRSTLRLAKSQIHAGFVPEGQHAREHFYAGVEPGTYAFDLHSLPSTGLDEQDELPEERCQQLLGPKLDAFLIRCGCSDRDTSDWQNRAPRSRTTVRDGRQRKRSGVRQSARSSGSDADLPPEAEPRSSDPVSSSRRSPAESWANRKEEARRRIASAGRAAERLILLLDLLESGLTDRLITITGSEVADLYVELGAGPRPTSLCGEIDRLLATAAGGDDVREAVSSSRLLMASPALAEAVLRVASQRLD